MIGVITFALFCLCVIVGVLMRIKNELVEIKLYLRFIEAAMPNRKLEVKKETTWKYPSDESRNNKDDSAITK